MRGPTDESGDGAKGERSGVASAALGADVSTGRPSAASIFGALPVPAVLLSEGRIVAANASFATLLHAAGPEVFVGQPFEELCLCEPEELDDALREALHRPARLVLRRPDETRLVVEANVGEADRDTLVVVRDMSEGARFQQVIARLSSLHIAATDASFRGVRTLLRESRPLFRALGWSIALLELQGDRVEVRDHYVSPPHEDLRADELQHGLRNWVRDAEVSLLPDLREVVLSCEGKLREQFPTHVAAVLREHGVHEVDIRSQLDLLTALGLERCVYAPVFLEGRVGYVLAVAGSQLSTRDYAAVQLLAAMLSAAEQIQRLSDKHAEERRLRGLGQMAAQLAHEVRNPIAVILTALGQIKRGATHDARSERLFGMVDEEIARLDRLVGDLVYFAAPLRVRATYVCLGEVVDEVVQSTARDAAREGAEVTMEPLVDLDIRVDPTLLRELLRRLLLNAYKPGVCVHVSGRVDGGDAVLRVEDDGPPLAGDVADQVFEPFFATRGTGAGLALAVVRRLAEDQGGAVSTVPGRGGVAFDLRFPLAGPRDPRELLEPGR